MASVYPRLLKGGEVWYAQVRLRSGAWHRYNMQIPVMRGADGGVAAANRLKALRKARELELAEAAGEDPFELLGRFGGHDLGDMIKRYLVCRAEAWSERTMPLHAYTLKMLVACLGDGPVDRIRKEAVDRFALYLRNARAKVPSPATVNIDLRNLSAFLSWVKREYNLPGWTVPEIKKLRPPDPDNRDYYSPEEAEALVRAASHITINSTRFGFYVAFLLLTGMRKREAFLRRSQIDLRSRLILLRGADTKGHRSDALPLTDPVQRLLDAMPATESGCLWDMSPWSGYIDDCWDKAVLSAGVRRLVLHNCRDTFAVNMIFEGVPLAVVSRLLRHRNIETTMKNYAAFSMEDIGAILRQGRTIQVPGTFTTAVLRGLDKYINLLD